MNPPPQESNDLMNAQLHNFVFLVIWAAKMLKGQGPNLQCVTALAWI